MWIEFQKLPEAGIQRTLPDSIFWLPNGMSVWRGPVVFEMAAREHDD